MFLDLENKSAALWTFLLFSGYLTPRAVRFSDKGTEASLVVPNREVKMVYREVFLRWMESGLTEPAQVEALVRSLLDGDTAALEVRLEALLVTMMSFYDPAGREPEKLYHGFILGLLVQLEGRYEVRSNRESGLGRADVLLRPKTPKQAGVVLELKVPQHRRKETPEEALTAGAKQLRTQRYAQALIAAGATPVYEIVVVFDGKRVWARTVEDILDSSKS